MDLHKSSRALPPSNKSLKHTFGMVNKHQQAQTLSKPKHSASQSTGSIVAGNNSIFQSQQKLQTPIELTSEAKRCSAAPTNNSARLMAFQTSQITNRYATRQNSVRPSQAPVSLNRAGQQTATKTKAISYCSLSRPTTSRPEAPLYQNEYLMSPDGSTSTIKITPSIQKKPKQTSCVRNFFTACTSCKCKGNRTQVSKSPPQPTYLQQKRSKLPQSSAQVIQTEPHDTQTSFRPKLLQPAGNINQRRRLGTQGSPNSTLRQSQQRIGSEASKSKERCLKQALPSTRLKTFSSDLTSATQALKQSQFNGTASHRNARQRPLLTRLKTTTVNSSQLIDELELAQLPQQLNLCISPRLKSPNELQSEPFEISPLRSSQKKKYQQHQNGEVEETGYSRRLQPNQPVITRIKRPAEQIRRETDNPVEETRITAEYADFSVSISSEIARSQNINNNTGGTEDDGQGNFLASQPQQYSGYDRSLLMQPESDTEQQINGLNETDESSDMAMITTDLQTSEINPMCLMASTRANKHQEQQQSSSTDNFMALANQANKRTDKLPISTPYNFKTPDNYCNKLKVAMINLSQEDVRLDMTDDHKRRSQYQMIDSERSDLEQIVSQMAPIQKDPFDSISNPDQIVTASQFGSNQHARTLEADSQGAADRSSQITIASHKPGSNGTLQCSVQSNIIDICITSTSEISLSNTVGRPASKELVSLMPSTYSRTKKSAQTAKMKTSFLQKAAAQQSHIASTENSCVTFRGAESKSSSVAVKTGKRRTSSQNNYKSISYKSVSRVELPMSSGRGREVPNTSSSIPNSPFLFSTTSKTLKAPSNSKSRSKNMRASNEKLRVSTYNRGNISPLVASLSKQKCTVVKPIAKKTILGLPLSLTTTIKSSQQNGRTSDLFFNGLIPVATPQDYLFNNVYPISFASRARSPPVKLNADLESFENSKNFGATSIEQVVIEPDIPLPHSNTNSSLVSGVSSVHNGATPAKGSSSELLTKSQITNHYRKSPASSVVALQHSRSSVHNKTYDGKIGTLNITKKLTLTPSRAFHSKPQMIQPPQQLDLTAKQLARQSTERQRPQKATSKEMCGYLGVVKSATSISKRSGTSKSPMTARPPAQKQNTSDYFRKSVSGVSRKKAKTNAKKFNPRDTIAYSDQNSSTPGAGSQIQSSSSGFQKMSKLAPTIGTLSQQYKTPQSRTSKYKQAAAMAKNSTGTSFNDSSAHLVNQEHDILDILDIRLKNKPFTSEETLLEQMQPKWRETKIIEISFDAPLQQKKGDFQVDPPIETILSEDRSENKRSFDDEKSQKQSKISTSLPFAQATDSEAVHIEVFHKHTDSNPPSGAGQQVMKYSGGFQKLEKMEGDDNDTDSCMSMSQVSSQRALDFTASRLIAAAAEQTFNKSDATSKDQQQLIVTRVTKRRCLNRYHSLEDEREPPSQMEKLSFGSLRSVRKLGQIKTRSMSQQKRLLYSKFLTTSSQGIINSMPEQRNLLKRARSTRDDEVQIIPLQDEKLNLTCEKVSEDEIKAEQTKVAEEEEKVKDKATTRHSNDQSEKFDNIIVQSDEKPKQNQEIEVLAATPSLKEEDELEFEFDNVPASSDFTMLLSPQQKEDTAQKAEDNDLTPSVYAEKFDYNRITSDIPASIRASKMFSKIEKSTESNLLDDLSKSLEKNAAANLLLDDEDLFGGEQDLLMDGMNPLDEMDSALLMGKKSLDRQILDMLDDYPIASQQLSTPSNKEGYFDFEQRQNNFVTPDIHSNYYLNEQLEEERKCSTQKLPRYLAEAQGSLSVISEEKSMQLQTSVSAASSQARGAIFLSATMSSAFNSARKLNGAHQQIYLRRVSSGEGKNQYKNSPSCDKRSEPDSPFSLQGEISKESLAGTVLRLNRQQSGDCYPFDTNMINDIDQPFSARSLAAENDIKKAYATESTPVPAINYKLDGFTGSVIRDLTDSDDNSVKQL